MILFFLLIIFLFPIAIYCSILSGINRRTTPLMVSGVWDGVGLLFASSGFFLVVAPAILSTVFDNDIKPMLLRGGRTVLPLWIQTVFGNWGVYWLGYYGLMILGFALFLHFRKRSTIIYNIETEVFENLIYQMLEENHVNWKRHGKKIILKAQNLTPTELSFGEKVESTSTSIDASNQVSSKIENESSFLGIEDFPASCNVTLTWHGEAKAYRQSLEKELGKRMEGIYTAENPASTWLLGISGGFFLLMIMGMLVVILSFLFGVRG